MQRGTGFVDNGPRGFQGGLGPSDKNLLLTDYFESNFSNSSKSGKSTFKLKNMQVHQNHCDFHI